MKEERTWREESQKSERKRETLLSRGKMSGKEVKDECVL